MVPSILIVGGGFCGVALSHALARLPWPEGARILVADRSGRFGRGAAYSTRHPSHVLNVPAGRMGALAEDEGHFLSWLRRDDASISGDMFVPRERYGDYLEHLFDESRQHAADGVTIDVLHDHVTSVANDGDRLRVKFDSSKSLHVDRMVIAVGNLPPRDIDAFSPVRRDAAYVSDPWAPGALERITDAQTVLMVGTGLTMVDAVLALRDSRPDATFIAVSRHGLLPLSHRDWPTKPVVIAPSAALERWDGSARALLHIVRNEARAADRAGLDWRDVINGLRPVTQSLWRRMSAREQARFYRHVRPYWDTHRHRMSTRVASAINAMIVHQQLSIVAGRVAACARDGGRVAVDVRRRDGQSARVVVDAIVNCTGPCSDYARTNDPLIADLRTSGMIVPDALGIGIETSDDGAVIGRDGRVSERLFTLGGTRRPALWESTAVPELRGQADTLARLLQRSLHVR